jgi:hypothetical protein
MPWTMAMAICYMLYGYGGLEPRALVVAYVALVELER